MSQWDYIWMGLVMGAGSFGHCLGMCGAFPLHLAAGRGVLGNLARQLPWHAGRIVTYVFLGALAGYLGGIIGSPERPWIQKGLTWLAGGAMILAGLAMLGLWPRRAARAADSQAAADRDMAARGDGLFASLFRQLFARPTPSGALVLGLACGFLPCGIVWTALALSIKTSSVPAGMATMAALGVGTVWSLLVLGLTGGLARQALRRWATAVAGAILIIMGAATVLRGSGLLGAALPHGQGHPASATTTQASAHPCCN
ncbi:MAG: sulfite exporter TauE/SafE family protein [Phycisphaerae bacterium]